MKNWNPEKEVPSLELCKRLKELGYPQEGGGWYWVKTAFGWILAIILDGIWLSTRNYIKVNDETIKDFIKAPTCRELGEWLKDYAIPPTWHPETNE